jgi:hypothetical protein
LGKDPLRVCIHTLLNAFSGLSTEHTASVYPLPKPGYHRCPFQLIGTAILYICHHQPGGIRPRVDDGYPAHRRNCSPQDIAFLTAAFRPDIKVGAGLITTPSLADCFNDAHTDAAIIINQEPGCMRMKALY